MVSLNPTNFDNHKFLSKLQSEESNPVERFACLILFAAGESDMDRKDADALVDKVVEQLNGELDVGDAEKIMTCSKEILSPYFQGECIDENSFSTDLVFRLLLLEGGNRSPLAKHCLRFLKDKYGLSAISFSRSGKLEIRVEKVCEETTALLEFIGKLDSDLRRKVKVEFRPKGENLIELIDYYGSYANKLYIKNGVKSYEQFEQLIKKCPNLTHLEIFSDKNGAITKISNHQNLKYIKFRHPTSITEISNLPNLENIGGLSRQQKLKVISNLPKVTELFIMHCGKLEYITELPSLDELYTSFHNNLSAISDLPNLSYFTFEKGEVIRRQERLDKYYLVPRMPLGFNDIARMTLLLRIAVKDCDRALGLYENFGVEESKIDGCIDYFQADDQVTIGKGKRIRYVSKGWLRKQAFETYPILFDLLSRQACKKEDFSLPDELQQDIDSGNVTRGLKAYYGVNPKSLRKAPSLLDSNAVITPLTTELIRSGFLKAEFLPKPTMGEELAFQKVMLNCVNLAEELGFSFDNDDPETYPQFLLDLIKNTTEIAHRIAREAEISEVWENYSANIEPHDGIQIRDTLDDYVKSVFLPHYIKSSEFEVGSFEVRALFDEKRLDMIEKFLSGTHLNVLHKLSKVWHHPAVGAELNKVKTFSDSSWEPLFNPNVSYDCAEHGQLTAVPLTTSKELAEEGERLKHCVGGYVEGCLNGSTHIISLRNVEGDSLSTMEIVISPQGKPLKDRSNKEYPLYSVAGQIQYNLQLIQHRGSSNVSPPEWLQDVKDKLLKDICKGIVPVNLDLLEQQRQHRVDTTDQRDVISFIGYDPYDPPSLEKAKSQYSNHGLKNAPKTLVKNFTSLTEQ